MIKRNAYMYVRGILSNVTSAQAVECQNDDVEVPNNTGMSKVYHKMRERLWPDRYELYLNFFFTALSISMFKAPHKSIILITALANSTSSIFMYGR